MTTTTTALTSDAPNFFEAKSGWRSWVVTTDHKRIGLLYLFGTVGFFLIAMTLAVLMRLELLFPGVQLFGGNGYNRILTLHGVVMTFLFIIPGIPAVFGNFFLPIQIGAQDLIFPRINLLSFYLYAAGGLLAVLSIAFGGGPDTGWTFYVPYATGTDANVLLPIIAAFILGWSSILTGLNFVTTVHRMRAPGMDWFRMPLFVWGLYATSWVQIIVTPVVGITLMLVLMERFLGIPIFDPSKGGDPILYQHLFWIYSHPAVYIMVLPAMGVVSEIIPTFSRRTIFGYKFIAYSSVAIASIGSLVWAHHMFTSGMADTARVVFSFLTFIVALPSGVKVFNWLATMYKGSIRLDPPMIFALMFIFLFSIGGLTGLIIGSLSTDIHLHDTSFIVAHFHYTMFGSGGVIFMAAVHYWFPKMFGRMYSFKLAYTSAGLFFIGFTLTYMPLFIAGYFGMPRRYADYLPEYQGFHQASTVGSWVMATSILLMVFNMCRAARKGPKAPDNPWEGRPLEWQVSTPPPTLNFDQIPTVTSGPYDYAE
ncbi:MAG: cbb3-type cytochrome c oxidase subunit I [Verrucomicrobiota bacterium]|jgi:cytochrome c oxidase subunit 1|nr:cbb3-type cytochrome c oxidase subunit I [Verrucomicrobiota bacterium]MDD8050527.1 cbb3-type cytochrome c oxidase subunit I [Verrucomicrobiota bacterium]MDI9385212.1 cbb3-type cytochrome c oxidase subunit I [Verrucomicrobiota bacterium]